MVKIFGFMNKYVLLLFFFFSVGIYCADCVEAYSHLSKKEFVEGYKALVDNAVKGLKHNRVRAEIVITGNEWSDKDINLIETYMKDIKEHLKKKYDIDLVSFASRYRDVSAQNLEMITSRIDLTFIVDEHIVFPLEQPGKLGSLDRKEEIKAKAEDFSAKINKYAGAVSADPGDLHARFNLAAAYQMQGEYEKAEAELKKILEMEDLPRARIMLGAVYVMQEKYPEAASFLDRAVFFDSGRWKVGSDGINTIKDLARIIKSDNANRPVRIDGHADYAESSDSSEILATKRAIAVALELISMNGVDPDDIFIQAYGDLDPIASNNEEKGRRLNRRVEIILPKKEDLN